MTATSSSLSSWVSLLSVVEAVAVGGMGGGGGGSGSGSGGSSMRSSANPTISYCTWGGLVVGVLVVVATEEPAVRVFVVVVVAVVVPCGLTPHCSTNPDWNFSHEIAKNTTRPT